MRVGERPVGWFHPGDLVLVRFDCILFHSPDSLSGTQLARDQRGVVINANFVDHMIEVMIAGRRGWCEPAHLDIILRGGP